MFITKQFEGRNAFIDYKDNNGQLYISFSKKYVENACNIEIHKTMIHEFIHADLKELYKIIRPFGGGSNPADLGEDLRDLSIGTINTDGGKSVVSNCN